MTCLGLVHTVGKLRIELPGAYAPGFAHPEQRLSALKPAAFPLGHGSRITENPVPGMGGL